MNDFFTISEDVLKEIFSLVVLETEGDLSGRSICKKIHKVYNDVISNLWNLFVKEPPKGNLYLKFFIKLIKKESGISDLLRFKRVAKEIEKQCIVKLNFTQIPLFLPSQYAYIEEVLNAHNLQKIKDIFHTRAEENLILQQKKLHILPLELFLFKKLIAIDLSNNFLLSFPKQEGWEQLEVLQIKKNQLLQMEISNCSKLRFLNLKKNKLKTLDISSLTNLEILNLNDNKLKNIRIGEANNLKILKLRNNSLIDLNGFNRFTYLLSLDLSGNFLRELPDMSCLKILTNINLSKNLLTKIDQLLELPNLEKIYLNNNYLKEILSFNKWQKVRKLYLQNNRIVHIGNLKDLSALKELDLSNNKLCIIPDFSVLLNLRKLNFSQNYSKLLV